MIVCTFSCEVYGGVLTKVYRLLFVQPAKYVRCNSCSKILLPVGIESQVKSCLHCKYSAVKHISIDKAWNNSTGWVKDG